MHSLDAQMRLEVFESQIDVTDKLIKLGKDVGINGPQWIRFVFKECMQFPSDLVELFVINSLSSVPLTSKEESREFSKKEMKELYEKHVLDDEQTRNKLNNISRKKVSFDFQKDGDLNAALPSARE
jgi:hypothetical protein